MAIDFLILCLLLISLIINLLALGAFWVTPGLRTTANRFVINLLIVNIIGCLILAPTLFLRSSILTGKPSIEKDIKIKTFTKNHYTFIHENGEFYEKDDIKQNDTITETNIIKCNGNKCTKFQIDNHHNNEKLNENTIVFTEMDLDFSKSEEEDEEVEENNNEDYKKNEKFIIIPSSVENIPTVIETDGSSSSNKNNAKSHSKFNNNNFNSKSNSNREFGVNNNLALSTNVDNEFKRKIEGLSSSSISEDSSSSKSKNDGISLTTYLQENQENLKKSSSSADLPSAVNNNVANDNNNLYIQHDICCWSLDLVAALGALSVLLIVGDTWCAITDPLRYHSRISGFKAWILIAITWLLGIFFGILSAFRETTTITTTTIEKHYYHNQNNSNNNNNNDTYEMTRFIEESLYNLIFSCVYFVIIILLPFGFVCGMYWRIFSEARENGLRMRQNGSSPLLQSAFNLSGHGPHTNNNNNNNINNSHNIINNNLFHQNHSTNHLSINHQNNTNNNNNNISNLTLTKDHIQGSTADCLQMRIDHNIKDGTTKPLLIQPELPQHNNTITNNYHNNDQKLNHHKDRNQNNILLTLSEATEDLKRNYSSRHLSILGSQDFYDGGHHNNKSTARTNGIRQVHSTPNLQKYQRNSNDSLIEIGDENASIRTAPRNALQLPTIIHTSPKALGYMTSIRHRLSNASSLFKYREESRAARISILVVIMFLVSYLPYGILVILQGRLYQLSNHTTQLAIFVVLLSNISSPFIFAYRNKRVRRGVKRLFNLDARAKDRKLQRRGVIAHEQGGLIKYPSTNVNNNGSKTATISLKRNGINKVTKYSINTTCKFLTPHAVTAAGTFLVDLEHCHYLKNGYTNDRPEKNCNDLLLKSGKCLTNSNNNNNINNNNSVPDVNLVDDLLEDDDDGLSDNSAEHNNDNSNSAEKRSILKIVCDSSRKLGCAGGSGNSCTSSDCENEPTDV